MTLGTTLLSLIASGGTARAVRLPDPLHPLCLISWLVLKKTEKLDVRFLSSLKLFREKRNFSYKPK